MTKDKRAARLRALEEKIPGLQDHLDDLKEGGKDIGKRGEQIKEAARALSSAKKDQDLLRTAGQKKNVYVDKHEEAEEELERLRNEEEQDVRAFRENFLTLLYVKLKTIERIQKGQRKPATANEKFLHSLDDRYPLEEGYKERSYYERGAIISPYKDMVELLHQIGVGPDLVKGLTVKDEEARPEVLNLPNLLVRLLTAIEVPNPKFAASDLPIPYYARTEGHGQYSKETDSIEDRLKAYAAMADHISHVFDLRLREDVASLRTIIESKTHFSLSKSSEIFSEVWEERNYIGSFLRLKNITKPQEAFQGIVQKYDPSFPPIPKEYLDAAVGPNPLGVLYRLLKATERKDIHSWNPTDEADLDARIKASDDIPRCFEDAVERIVSRHYNKILLEKMADKVRAVLTQPAPASLGPRQASRSAVPAAARAPVEVVVVAAPPPPVVQATPVPAGFEADF